MITLLSHLLSHPIVSEIVRIAQQASYILFSFLGISFILVFHEFGHFLFSKLCNVYTPTFSIGMGKILASKKIGATNFCISAAPIGGYVEIASESEEIDQTKYLGFNDISYYKKIFIMLGGILFNFMLTYLILVCLFFIGIPDFGQTPYEANTTYIAQVPTTSINANTLHAQDRLVSLNNQPIHDDIATARYILQQHVIQKSATQPHSTIQAEIQRDGNIINTELNIQKTPFTSAISKQLDISFKLKPGLSLSHALIQAYIATEFYLFAIINGLKDMVSAHHTAGLAGPLKAMMIGSKFSQKGFASLMFFIAIMSINLGFMNFLPLPIFDGGQFVIFTIEAIIRRQLSEKIRQMIGLCSWILIIGLLVIFTILDVLSFF